jgi:hypothetical protein
MAIVVPAGTLNLNATQAPNVIVQFVPPSEIPINGVPTNRIGMVGTSVWGPTNVPVIVGGMTDGAQKFGNPQNAKHDLMTGVYVAALNGTNDFRCVRVTDGTDVEATVDILDTAPATGMTITAKYTGTYGNQIKVVVGTGSAANTFKITIGVPGLVPEVFDNIAGSGATFWTNAVNAINLGTTGQAPSTLVFATDGAGTAAPALATYTLAGGTNGGVPTTGDFIGLDVGTRTGMYALRGTQCSEMFICDMDDPTSYSTQEAFSISEGMYVSLTGVSGQSVAQAITALNTSAVATKTVKFLVGDWCYLQDPFNNVLRLISPQSYCCGRLANLAPPESGLNKPIVGLVGTESSYAHRIYSNADIVALAENGLDVIASPSPGGRYFALQTGQNTSTNPLENDDGFVKLDLYLGYSIATSLGAYIGQLQTPSVRASAKASLVSFLQSLVNIGWIGDVNGGPAFKVVLDASNNPANRVAQGYMQADVQVVDYRVIRVFLINLQNGQVTLQSVTPVQ